MLPATHAWSPCYGTFSLSGTFNCTLDDNKGSVVKVFGMSWWWQWGIFLLHSDLSAEATCKNMPGSLSIRTSKSLFLQSSITPGWGCCSGCWGSLPLQGQTLGLPGEWRYARENKLSSFAPMLGFTVYSFLMTEYIERYGTNPVWAGYRRNHKGGIPPQKTRKTCIVKCLL